MPVGLMPRTLPSRDSTSERTMLETRTVVSRSTYTDLKMQTIRDANLFTNKVSVAHDMIEITERTGGASICGLSLEERVMHEVFAIETWTHPLKNHCRILRKIFYERPKDCTDDWPEYVRYFDSKVWNFYNRRYIYK